MSQDLKISVAGETKQVEITGLLNGKEHTERVDVPVDGTTKKYSLADIFVDYPPQAKRNWHQKIIVWVKARFGIYEHDQAIIDLADTIMESNNLMKVIPFYFWRDNASR